jgi:hypothetical protein
MLAPYKRLKGAAHRELIGTRQYLYSKIIEFDPSQSVNYVYMFPKLSFMLIRYLSIVSPLFIGAVQDII